MQRVKNASGRSLSVLLMKCVLVMYLLLVICVINQYSHEPEIETAQREKDNDVVML